MTKTRSSQASSSSKDMPKAVATTAKGVTKGKVVSPDSKAASYNNNMNKSVIDNVPVFDFATLFGANAKESKTSFSTRNCKLKVATIQNIGLAFKIDPMDPKNHSAWSEKMFADAVKEDSKWINAINIQKYVPVWYDNNIKMKNNKGYPIRMFIIKFEEGATVLKEEGIILIGEFICECLNKMTKNSPITSLDKDDLFWLKEGIWSDVLGHDQAFVDLKIDMKRIYFEPMEKKVNLIFQYFKKEDVTEEMLSQLFPDVNIGNTAALQCFVNVNDEEPNEAIDVDNEENYELVLPHDESDEENEFDE